MQVGIIGQGRVGTALAEGWRRAGHDVRSVGRSSAMKLQEIVTWADVIALAVPWAAIRDVAADIGPMADKVVIDCTNPITQGPDGLGLAMGLTTSGGEVVQSLFPRARIVKTLNQVGAELMANATAFSRPPVQFMAGNSDDAKSVVARLLSDLGFEALDAGDMTRSRLLEPFALTWINQAIVQGKGRNWALAVMELDP